MSSLKKKKQSPPGKAMSLLKKLNKILIITVQKRNTKERATKETVVSIIKF